MPRSHRPARRATKQKPPADSPGSPSSAAALSAPHPPIERIRHEHLGWLLERADRVFARFVSRAVHARGFADVRLVHVALIRSIEDGGTRITDIARRTGMTKQATGKLVTEFVGLGYIRIVADPADGRVKMAEYTAKGRRLLRAIVAAITETERRVTGAIGRGEVERLKAALTRFIVATEE